MYALMREHAVNTVDTACDGEDAQVMARSAVLVVIVLDVAMPRVDAVEVIARLHDQEPDASTPSSIAPRCPADSARELTG
jgi:YesN/AraC family two-component response regulator